MAGTSSSEIHIAEFPPNLNVLVIDTDPGALEVIEKSCKENSHQVVICSESSRAVDVLLKKEIDIRLIIMELHMPMMDGYEFLQFLNKEEIDIPFVMMSEDSTWFSMTKAFHLGAIYYFLKPFNNDKRLDLWAPLLRHYYDRLNKKDDETSDGSEFASDGESDGEAEADDTLHKKDDTLIKKE
ncbi:Two-component response regulator [Vigna angularis]|uniref:Two-component response regulator n=1 Tax=Phaseolus angularis TaxID=3914 RepID=A0A8T0LIH6_PHAAN|nr:two-component response regulator ARR14-like isoform X2 [Vigna angularis]XP_017409242.2 two-component response regulator ARR14-like isoform X2 [Vigna angularis]KAG2410403.1 Two-component response regulator [Vigna angularis]